MFAPNVIVPVFLITTPPVLLNVAGHSNPVFLAVEVLYCKVEFAPNVGVSEAVAVPSIERVSFTVTPVVAFTPDSERVRLVYVVGLAV